VSLTLLWVGMALAKPTGLDASIGGIPADLNTPLQSATLTVTLDVEMRPVDGISMSRARKVSTHFVLTPMQGDPVPVEASLVNSPACRFRVPLAGPWQPGSALTVSVVITGDSLPMALDVQLPPGAKPAGQSWRLPAPTGELILTLPACG